MKSKELIENLERIEAVMIPSCFKVDMDPVKGQMLQLLDKMTLNTMKRPDVVAVLEIFLAYLRGDERPKGKWVVKKLQNGFEDVYCPYCNARPTRSEYGYYLKDKFCHECGADMRQEEQS